MNNKIEKALEYYKNKDWNQAIDAFSSVLETEGDKAEIYNNIALCYANLGDDVKAEKNYLKAEQLDSSLPHIYINLSDIYYKTKRFGEGIEMLTRGIYALPENMVLRHYLARFYMEDAKLDLAIDELDKVLDAQPENYDAYYDLGRVYFELGVYDSAIEAFENVLELKNDNEWVYYYLGQAYEANDEIDKAISNYIKATAINFNFPPAFKKLGILFMARGEFEDAIEYFEDYLKKDIPDEETKNINGIIARLKTKSVQNN